MTTSVYPRRQRRRQFLRNAAGGAAGLAGVLASPAIAQTRELTFLTIASFVPDTDKELKRQFEEWGAKNKVKVRLDIIAHLQLQTKKAAEVQARSGHDLTALGPGLGDADLYFDHLTDLSDVSADVAPQNGGWLSPNDYLIRGKWALLPWWLPPFPMAIRTDLLEQIGEKNPDTWEDWLRIGEKRQDPGARHAAADRRSDRPHQHAARSEGPQGHNSFLLRRHLELLEKRRARQRLPAVPLPA